MSGSAVSVNLTNEFLSLLHQESTSDRVQRGGSSDQNLSNDSCLLTGDRLQANFVTTECGHTFNYKPLFREIETQRFCVRPYDTDHVGKWQIRCPYCRTITDGLIPFIPTLSERKVKFVNWPPSKCIAHKTCKHLLSGGRQRRHICGAAGFDCFGTSLCLRHYKQYCKTEQKLLGDGLSKAASRYIIRFSHEALRSKARANGVPEHGTKIDLAVRLSREDETITLYSKAPD